jgi:hypothetical protein
MQRRWRRAIAAFRKSAAVRKHAASRSISAGRGRLAIGPVAARTLSARLASASGGSKQAAASCAAPAEGDRAKRRRLFAGEIELAAEALKRSILFRPSAIDGARVRHRSGGGRSAIRAARHRHAGLSGHRCGNQKQGQTGRQRRPQQVTQTGVHPRTSHGDTDPIVSTATSNERLSMPRTAVFGYARPTPDC